jgi:hypothetical protein
MNLARLHFLLALFYFSQPGWTQEIPDSRLVNWSGAGLIDPLPEPTVSINFEEAGGIGDGVTVNNDVFYSIIEENEGAVIEVFFPTGTFLFDSTLHVPDNIILNGEGAASTFLKFDFSGIGWPLINAAGGSTGMFTAAASSLMKNDQTILVEDASGYSPGDWIQVRDNDLDSVVSDWAEGQTGQLVRIASIEGDEIIIEQALRRNYPLEKSPEIVQLNMRKNVQIKNMHIERLDFTDGQARGIRFSYAVNCLVSCVESEKGDFGHVVLEHAAHCEVSGSYFHHAHDYGGGGNGYGVVCQITSGDCLIRDNNFEHLRHSILLQAGANGNVVAYNYSTDPYWDQDGYPSDAAGDLVLHGNYVYANLFEGNVVQNISVDESHGMNGPFNLFLRNRVELYGIVNGVSSPRQTYIGNEITNGTLFYGLFLLSGEGHFSYGNNHVGDVSPEGTSLMTVLTLFYDDIPFYYESYSSWPPIGYPNALNDYTVEAENNYEAGYKIQCDNTYEDLSVNFFEQGFLKVYPNPVLDVMCIANPHPMAKYGKVYDEKGQLVHDFQLDQKCIPMPDLVKGMYTLILYNSREESAGFVRFFYQGS